MLHTSQPEYFKTPRCTSSKNNRQFKSQSRDVPFAGGSNDQLNKPPALLEAGVRIRRVVVGPKCPRCRADVLVLGSWLTTSRDVGQKANNNKTTAVKINLKHRGTKNKGTEGQLLYILYSDCVQGYVHTGSHYYL